MNVAPLHLRDLKRLDEMNRLADMGRFPLAVYCGATANVLVTIALTRWFEQKVAWMFPASGIALLMWIAFILALNLTPVIVLRTLDRQPPGTYRYVHEMNFFADQHRFSDWVYVVASANMSFWIVAGWVVFASFPGPGALGALLGVAFVVTFFPAWVRLLR